MGVKPDDRAGDHCAQVNAVKPVGGGLPPMGPAQAIPARLTHRHRGQAPSHPGSHWPLDGCNTWRPSRGPLCSSERRQTCGGGLPTMGLAQSIPGLLTHCYRGQAPSHLGYRWSLDGCKPWRPSRGPLCSSQRRQNCGRGLAPDGACSVDTCVADPPLSAKPPPTLGYRWSLDWRKARSVI